MRRMKRVLSMLLVLCMIFAMVPSFAMAAEGEELGVTTEITPVETTPVEETPAEEPTEESLETLAPTYEATFWTGEAADQPVNCATLKEALEMLNKDGRTRTGKEVITLLKNVDIANRAGSIYFADAKGTSATYAIYVMNGGFTLDLGGYTIRTSAGFMQTYNTDSAKALYKTFTTDALKTVTVKNGTVMVSVEGIDANQSASDKAGRATINHHAGNLTFENIKVLGSYQNNILMNPSADGLYGTLTINNCELFAPCGAESSLLAVSNGNTAYIVDSKLGAQNGVPIKLSSQVVCNVSGDTTVYYTGDGCFSNAPVLPTGKVGVIGTGSYTTSTGLVLTDAKTWTVGDAVAGTLAAGFTAVGGSEVKYYFDTELTEDNTAEKIYTTAEKAVAAAMTAWDAAGKGTVNVYSSFAVSDVNLFPGGDKYGLVHVGKDQSLTLNLADGVVISEAAVMTTGTAYVAFLDDNAELTINGGKIVYAKSTVIQTTGSKVLNFNGTITLNNVTTEVTGGKSVVQNYGLGGDIIFNGGKHVVYNVKGDGTVGGSGMIVNLGKEAYESTTAVHLRGGVDLWNYQYVNIRVGQNAKVYAENVISHANAKSGTAESSIRDDQDDCWGIAGYYTSGGSTAYTGHNVVLGSKDGTVTSTMTTAAAADRPQFPELAYKNTNDVQYLATEVTVAPKTEAEASYTPAGGSTTEYEKLDDAITAMKAAPGGTVKLLKDINYTTVRGPHASTSAYAFDFSDKTSWTLDLNGYTLETAEGGFRSFAEEASFKVISSAAAKGTLICGMNSASARNAISIEKGSVDLTLDNVKVVASGSNVRRVATDAGIEDSITDCVLYVPASGIPYYGGDNSTVKIANSILAASGSNVPVSAANISIDGNSVIYHNANKTATPAASVVTTDPAGLVAKTTENETFAASTYFTGMADATGLKKTVWAAEQMPAGTVASFTGADGVCHLYGVKETSGTYELTVDGVVDATTYAASYTDKTRATGFAMGLAMMAAKDNDCIGTITLYTDVTLNNGNNGDTGGVYGTNGGTSSAIMSTPKDADIVLNLNDHTLTLADLDNKGSLMKLSYVNQNTKFTINDGMDGVEGTDSNGNTIVGGGTGKIVSNTTVFWLYSGENHTTFNGVDIDAVNAVALRNAKRTGTVNFNGGHFVGTQVTGVQTGTSHTGSTMAVNVGQGFTADCDGVYAFRLAVETESLNIYDAVITTNKTSDTSITKFDVETYVVRFWAGSSGVGYNQPVRWNASNNVTHTVVEDAANSNIIHTFTRGSAVATYQADESATPVTCYSWAEAKTAAKAGGIVTLLDDVDYTSANDYFLDIAVAKDLTLDMNGHTVESTKGIVAYNFGNKNTNTETVDCVLKVKNGTIITSAVSLNQKRGIMQLDGVKIIQTTANNPTVELGTQVENSDIKIDVPATGEGSYIRNSEIYAANNWHAVILSNAGAGNKPHLTVENSIIATADDNNKGYAIGVRYKSHYTGLIVDLKGVNKFYTYNTVTEMAPSANITFTGMPVSAMKSDQKYTFSGADGYSAENLNMWETTYTGGFTYTTAAGESTWYAELGNSTGMNKDNGTIDSAFEALANDPTSGGTITFFESVFYGDKATYGSSVEVTLADGTKEMAKVDSTFVDKNVSNGYIFNSTTKDYTIDLNGHGMFMCDEAVSTSNYTAVIIGLQSNNKTAKVEMKDGTIVWAGQKRPFCTGTSSAKDSAYTLTMTDIFYENKGVSGASGNEAFYVQDKSTVILDGGYYKDSGDTSNTDGDGIVCVNDNDRAATVILRNGVVLESCRNAAISMKGDDDVLKVESDLGATVRQAKKADAAADMIAGSGSVEIGDLTFLAPKETSAPYKHEIKKVYEVAYYFAPGADTDDLTKGTGYATLEDAIAASQDAAATPGGTVKLIKDIDYTTNADLITLDSNSKTFTLDLGGFTLSNAFANRLMNCVSLEGNASITVKNGIINWIGGGKNASNSTVGVYVITTSTDWSGTLLVENVDITNHCVGKVIGISGTGTVTLNGGSVTSNNAPLNITKPADNTVGHATLNLIGGVNIRGGFVTTANNSEGSSIRVSTSILPENAPVINIEDAVFWNLYNNKGDLFEIASTLATPNYTVNLTPGAEFFVSSDTTDVTFKNVSSSGTSLSDKTEAMYMHSVGTAVAEYTDGAGVTTKYSDLYSASQAMISYYNAQANKGKDTKVGTIKLLSDIEIDEGTPMNQYGIFVNNAGTFTIDLNGYTISTAEGYTLDRCFMIQTNNAINGTIQNGNIDITSTSDIFKIGNSTMEPDVDLTFKYVNANVDGGASILNSQSDNGDFTFDGGKYFVHSATSGKSVVFKTTKNNEGVVKSNFYLKGGVVIEQGGYHNYAISLSTTKGQQIHIYDAAFSSYGSYIYSSSWLETTAVLYNRAGEAVTFDVTGDAFKTAFMKFFTREVIQPSIYTDSGYNTSYNLFRYNVELGTAEQQADSVAKSTATGLYYNVDELVNYMGKLSAADTITAVADIDTTKTEYGKISGNASTLTTDDTITYELGSFTLTADIVANDTLTVNGGTFNGDVTAASGITATGTTVGGDLTVNGGEMSLTGTNVRGDLAVNAEGAHLISGGTIAAAVPVQLAKDAVLTVADNATIDGSNGAAAQGEGAIIFKEAVVKFATGTQPYGTMITEGFYTDSDNGTVTTRTYTKAGDPVQGTNVAMLVENETYFATLKEAHDAASKLTHETIMLVADTTEPAFTVDREIVIDLGGFKAVTEITVASEGVLISNGTLATANGDAVTVTDGDTTLSEVTVSATGSALVVNGANAAANVYASKLTGDTNSDDTGYAIDVQAAASVFVSETTILSGAVNHAGIAVGANVAYEVVTVESGEIYIPKAYYEATRQWAEGQEKITCLVNTVSRYAYDMTVENAADGTNARNSFYVASAAAPAAMIGKVGYATLKEAIDAAKKMNNAEIVLMRDIHIDDEYADTINYANTTSVYLITLNKAMTIDFNGFTIYGARGGRYQLFNVTGGATVRMKNGTIDNRFPESASNSAKGDYTISNNANLYLDDMNIYAWMYCVNSTTSNSTAKFYINGGTFVSDSRWAAFSNTPNKRTNPEWFVTGGAKFISMASDTSSTYVAGVTSQYTGFCIDDAYIYYNASADATKLANALPKDAPYEQLALPEGANGVEQTGHMAVDENGNKIASLLATYTEMYNGESFTVNYYGVGNVAKIADTEYASLDAALTAAAADNSTDPVVLLKDVTVNSNVEIPAGETLDLNGKKVTFNTVGFMTITGAMNTNGGTIESEGNVSIAAGATIDGYAYRNAALLNTKLNLQAVSLSLNDYVDINLKYSETDTASFNGAVVNVDGTTVNLAKTANGYNVYKIENLTAADYAAAKWVIMEANAGNDACVGLPVKVSVMEYAKKVVAANDYGIASDLGMTMTALMDYAGSAIDNAVHTDIADFGTAMSTDNGVLSVAGDFTNGYALKVTSTTAGTLTVAHTDVYGKQFTQNFTVAAGETVTYTMMHVADAKQTVTITLTVDGSETSKLETTLASAATGADKAIVVSNLAEKFFTGK